MTRTRTYAHGCTAATLGLLAAGLYSATFEPWLIAPGVFGAATTAVLAAGLYNADHREREILQRLERLLNSEPLRPTALTEREQDALALLEQQLTKDAA